jgi:hypothetical protein
MSLLPTPIIDVRWEIGAVSEAVTVPTKWCSRCKVMLPREMFTTHAGAKDGLQMWCRACQNAHQRERYANDPLYREKVIARACERARRQRDTAVGWATQVLGNARKRAKKDGVPFDLTVEHLLELRERTSHCPVLGIELVYHHKGFIATNSASLDCIYQNDGYVAGNVVIISYRADRAKKMASRINRTSQAGGQGRSHDPRVAPSQPNREATT